MSLQQRCPLYHAFLWPVFVDEKCWRCLIILCHICPTCRVCSHQHEEKDEEVTVHRFQHHPGGLWVNYTNLNLSAFLIILIYNMLHCILDTIVTPQYPVFRVSSQIFVLLLKYQIKGVCVCVCVFRLCSLQAKWWWSSHVWGKSLSQRA